MHWKSHNYQDRVKEFLRGNSAIVRIGMGGGKTVVALTAAVEHFRRGLAVNCLIIAPKAVALDVWPTEMQKWDHLAGYSMAIAVGDPIIRQNAVRMNADFVVTNYDNIGWLCDMAKLHNLAWDIVILDEITRFKQHDGRNLAAFMRWIRPRANYVWGLTASPVTEGDFTDLWGMLYAIDKGITLGETISDYRGLYYKPGFRGRWDWKLREDAPDRIMARINKRQKIVKVDDAEIAAQLPPLMKLTRRVDLPAKVMAQHDQLKNDLILMLENGETLASPNVATALNRCLQLAGGAVYDDTGENWISIHDDKLKALDDVLEEHGRVQVLIAYQFRHEWARFKKRYPDAREARDKNSLLDWRNGTLRRMFLHPASAGEGLNLQTGSHLIWYSKPWSFRLFSQTLGRIYRQGQRNPVLMTDIFAARTVDALVTLNHSGKRVTETTFLEALKTL